MFIWPHARVHDPYASWFTEEGRASDSGISWRGREKITLMRGGFPFIFPSPTFPLLLPCFLDAWR